MKNYWVPFLMLLAVWLWAGMIVGISFIEAPVKFTAPNVTLGIGLGIGRLVFAVMNKVEIACCAVLLSGLFFHRMPKIIWTVAGSITAILALQTAWLLPDLDIRALAVIAGEPTPPSNLHFVYVALELSKFMLLILAGSLIFRTIIKAAGKSRNSKTNTYKKPAVTA
jgi:hypothetical protein